MATRMKFLNRTKQRRTKVLENMKKNMTTGPISYQEATKKEFERLSSKWGIQV